MLFQILFHSCHMAREVKHSCLMNVYKPTDYVTLTAWKGELLPDLSHGSRSWKWVTGKRYLCISYCLLYACFIV